MVVPDGDLVPIQLAEAGPVADRVETVVEDGDIRDAIAGCLEGIHAPSRPPHGRCGPPESAVGIEPPTY